MATPLGSAAMVLLYQALISSSGWRSAFVALAGLLLVGVAVPGAILLRRRPEDLGLLPDGAQQPPSARVATGAAAASRPARQAAEVSFTFSQAIRTRTYWLVVSSVSIGALATGTLGFHLAAYLTDRGLEPALAAGAVSTFALSAAAASTVYGLLLERIAVRGLFTAVFAIATGGVLLLLEAQTAPLAFLAAFVLGSSARTLDALNSITLASYFGRRAFGAISGLTGPFMLGALGLGPLAAAWLFDRTGSYQLVLQLLVVAYALSALLIFLARPPAPP
jgi:sugar phosphate permease